MSSNPSLTLEVFIQDDSLKLSLTDQSQLIPTLRHYSQVSVSFEELKQLAGDIFNTLNLRAHDQAAKAGQLARLRKEGQLLWDYLFSRSIKEKLKSESAGNLTLSLDEELIYLPWEILFDGKDFLCLKFSLGRLVRSKGDSGILQYRNLSESLRMLVLADPNADLKSAYLEGLNIKNQFNRKTKKVYVDFKSNDIDKNYVKKYICDYDIVHFAGHCEFDRKDPKNSGWMLSDGLFKPEDILKMANSADLPALIFSNACYSAKLCEDNEKVNFGTNYQLANYSMASAFLFAGVRHYIGSIRKVEDNASLIFAKEFYIKLICGISVGQALRLAKLKLVKEFGLESLHWANYLVYGDPAYVFFKTGKHRNTHHFGSLIKKFKARIGVAFACVFLSISTGMLLPKISPDKLYLFISSQNQFRKGNNEAAIEIGRKVIGKDKNFLSVYPIVANAYQKMGEKEKALKYYFEYMMRSEKLGNKNHLIDAYTKLGWFYHLEGNYDKAKELYEKAINLSLQLKNKQKKAVALRKLAVWHIDKKEFEKALDLLTKSSAINLEKINNFEASKNLACDYFDIGLVFANKNDYQAAKDFYLKSMEIFERLHLSNELSDCYFNLGEIFLYEKQFGKALDYYSKGLKIDLGQNNKVNLACDYNMIGELYAEMDDPQKAEDSFKKSYLLAEKIDSKVELANSSYNLGILYKRQRRKNLAREYLRKAQEIYRLIEPEKLSEIRLKLQEIDAN